MRRLLAAAAALAVVLLLASCWVAWRGASARKHLLVARAHISALEIAMLDGDSAAVDRALADVGVEAAAAHRLTSDPVWRALARVPYAGRTLRTVGGLAATVDALATDALPPLADAYEHLTPRVLRPRGDTIAVDRLAAAREPLRRVVTALENGRAGVRRLPSSGVLAPVVAARDDLARELDRLAGSAASAADTAEVGPALLGASGRRRYLLAVLTNAEMRGSGGLLGAYGVLEADRGRLSLTTLGSNSRLRDARAPVADIAPDFTARFRRFGADSAWVNANMSAHFPYADRSWRALWAHAHRGDRLDGTLAIDPVAMAEVLRVTGPAAMPGETLGADTIVDLTERAAYERFPDGPQRDAFLLAVGQAVWDQALSGRGDTRALLSGLGRAAGGRHLQFAAARPEEQRVLERWPLAGALPDQPGPYLEVVTQNAGGNKLDYYLRRSITYAARPAGAGLEASVEVRLRNTAPARLPAYVAGRLDLPGGAPVRPGQARFYVSVYAGQGAGLRGATLGGRPLAMESEVERGHAVFSAFVDVDRGAEVVVRLDIAEPRRGEIFVRDQPVVVPDEKPSIAIIGERTPSSLGARHRTVPATVRRRVEA